MLKRSNFTKWINDTHRTKIALKVAHVTPMTKTDLCVNSAQSLQYFCSKLGICNFCIFNDKQIDKQTHFKKVVQGSPEKTWDIVCDFNSIGSVLSEQV